MCISLSRRLEHANGLTSEQMRLSDRLICPINFSFLLSMCGAVCGGKVTNNLSISSLYEQSVCVCVCEKEEKRRLRKHNGFVMLSRGEEAAAAASLLNQNSFPTI